MRITTAVAALLLTSTLADHARPCGAIFPSRTSQNLAIDAQRALLVVGEDQVALHLQLATASDGEAFSWIIPVPGSGGVPTVALGDQAVFDALDALTTPTVTVAADEGGGGFGCGSAAKTGDGAPRSGGVQHFGGGALGDYTYDILAGSDTAAIQAWLEDHGYLVPEGFEAAITPYTARSKFVAVRLAAGGADGAVNEPIVLTWSRPFGETSMGYAFGLSKLSSAPTQPLLLWLLADKRQRVANYGSTQVREVAEVMRDRGLDYAGAIDALTDEAGGRLVTTEFAKDLREIDTPAALAALVDDASFYLTRLYAEVPREQIEDLVITFAADAPDVEPAVTVSLGGGGALALAGSFLVLALRRRRGDA